MTPKKGRPEYIFVVEDKIGGVTYLNKNLINNTTIRDEVFVKVILMDQVDGDHPRFPDRFLADEMVRFKYSGLENRYSVLKRFHALLGTGPGAIICNEGLEMEAIYLFGAEKTVFQIVHDFYNIGLAVKFGAITDVYVTHTRLFRDVLLSSDPSTVQSFWLQHGVPIPEPDQGAKDAAVLKLIFAGRLVESKGVQELWGIDRILKSEGIRAEWTIIGRGPLKDFLVDQWQGAGNITFASPDTNEEVMQIMARHDLFVLPTRFEGSPVTVLEALSSGLVPIVSDLPGGITEIVSADIGRRVPIGDTSAFAAAIAVFQQDRKLLREMSANCRALAEKEFDILKTSNEYFRLFGRFAELKKANHARSPIRIGFRLDKKWLPNAIVRFLRKW